MMRSIGLYVHIPFCKKKCTYCDFSSYANREQDMERYIEQVLAEINQKRNPAFEVSTLYIGGGTPSLLPAALMQRLLSALHSAFPFADDAECTCECNPGTVTPEFFTVLAQNGINRISFGAQAAQPALLSLLGRIHVWEQVEEAVHMAHACSIHNMNLDIMLGLPTQTTADVEETLQKALALSPTHLSCYGLIVEEHTVMQKMVESGTWQLPDDDTEREMYEICRTLLRKHGMEQYEISNFSLPGYACRHNIDCWKRKEYLGIGCAACGFLDEQRIQNPVRLEDYLAGAAPQIVSISTEEARFESLMLGLRMTAGVSEADFYRMHGVSLLSVYGERLKKPMAEGLVLMEDGHLKMTRRGMDVQNRILVECL